MIDKEYDPARDYVVNLAQALTNLCVLPTNNQDPETKQAITSAIEAMNDILGWIREQCEAPDEYPEDEHN